MHMNRENAIILDDSTVNIVRSISCSISIGRPLLQFLVSLPLHYALCASKLVQVCYLANANDSFHFSYMQSVLLHRLCFLDRKIR